MVILPALAIEVEKFRVVFLKIRLPYLSPFHAFTIAKSACSAYSKRCFLPLTGVNCVKKIVTELAVLDVTPFGFKLLERAPGVTVDEIKSKTAGKLIVEGEIAEMQNI